jgi:acetyltransferase-like isoleucine patch superfamily enzyme
MGALRLGLRARDQAVLFAQVARGYVRASLSPGSFGPYPILIGRVRLRIRGKATFGARFMVHADVWDVRLFVSEGGRLAIGEGVFLNGGCSIEAWHDVRIGKGVLLAPFVSIIDDDCHEVEPGSSGYKGPTIIGDGVWLGRNVSVLPGVKVGDGSVVGANSVVSRDIPPNCFAAGVPARVIRELDIPERWDHRYGFEADQSAAGFMPMLRKRLRVCDERNSL